MRKIQKINSNLFCSFQKMSAASKNILMASLAYNMWVMLERLDKIDDKENNIKIQSVLFSISTRARVTSHFSIFLSYKKNCRHLINHWLSLYYSQGFALNHHCQFSFFSTSCHAMIFVLRLNVRSIYTRRRHFCARTRYEEIGHFLQVM